MEFVRFLANAAHNMGCEFTDVTLFSFASENLSQLFLGTLVVELPLITAPKQPPLQLLRIS